MDTRSVYESIDQGGPQARHRNSVDGPPGYSARAGAVVLVGAAPMTASGGPSAAAPTESLPTDPLRQLDLVVAETRSRLQAQSAHPDALVKLALFYVPVPGFRRGDLVTRLSNALGAGPSLALTVQPVPALGEPGQLVALDAIAIGESGGPPSARETVVSANHSPVVMGAPVDAPARFCSGVRCGDFAFVSGQWAAGPDGRTLAPDNLAAQNEITLERVAATLEGLGLTASDIVKFHTWRAPPPSKAAYREAAAARFDFLRAAGPVVTGITMPNYLPGGALIQVDAWAMPPTADGQRVRRRLSPQDHWDWSSPTPYSQGLSVDGWIFVGGQASLDRHGAVLDSNQVLAQHERTLQYIERVLSAASTTKSEVVASRTYWCPGAGVLPETAAGLPSTRIGVDHLAYSGQCVEIDAVAWRRDYSPAL